MIEPIHLDLPEELLGPRVLVRPYRPGDGAAMWQAIDESREHLRPWMPWVDQHECLMDSEAFIRHAHARWTTREDLPLGIWEREMGRYLGSTGMHPRDWDVPWFEIGYWLRAGAEGHGYVTEAVALLLRLAFEALGAKRVHLQCDPQNERSAAVPRRLGIPFEARLRNHARSTSGELRDTLVFAMTPEEYAAERGVIERILGEGVVE